MVYSFIRPVFNFTREKGTWCFHGWSYQVKVFSYGHPKAKNTSEVGNLISELWAPNANEGVYLLLFLSSPLKCNLGFQKTSEQGVCTDDASLPSVQLSGCHIDSPHASIRKARQVIIVNKKPIQWRTGSFSSKAEYHYSMNGSIIYSRAITCSDEAMLIG